MRAFYKLLFVLTFGVLSSVYLTHQKKIKADVRPDGLSVLGDQPVLTKELSVRLWIGDNSTNIDFTTVPCTPLALGGFRSVLYPKPRVSG